MQDAQSLEGRNGKDLILTINTTNTSGPAEMINLDNDEEVLVH